MSDQIIKEIKEVPHEKEKCIYEMRWYLLQLLDEKDEFRKTCMIKFALEHLHHI